VSHDELTANSTIGDLLAAAAMAGVGIAYEPEFILGPAP